MQFSATPNSSSEELDPDAAIRSTDLDALVSRHSAAAHALISDSYSIHFLPSSLRRNPPNRPPLINIGTHARTWSVDRLVQQFLDHARDAKGKGRACQVISLGAGTDSRYWRLRDDAEKRGEEWNCAAWVELDFAQATSTKARAIATKKELSSGLRGAHKIERGGTALVSSSYALLPIDLREFSSVAPSLLSPSGPLSPDLPTLLLAECVFIYLPPSNVTSILSWFSSTYSHAGGFSVAYDPFGLDDNFGKVMIRNLATRHLTLPSAASTPDLESLSRRLLDSGFSSASSLSLRQIRDRVIPADEASRVTKIEQLDELEELNLVLDHYAMTWGSVGDAEALSEIGLVQCSVV